MSTELASYILDMMPKMESSICSPSSDGLNVSGRVAGRSCAHDWLVHPRKCIPDVQEDHDERLDYACYAPFDEYAEDRCSVGCALASENSLMFCDTP